MAIYNNREVLVVGPNPQANSPESINVRYMDGTHENVKLSSVKFTEDEKKSLQKQYPSKYDSVETVKDEDLKAVRVGIPPTYDKATKEAAELKAQQELQQKLYQEQADKSKAEAEKNLDKKMNAPTPQVKK